jgi:hypothetical protein
LVVAVLPGEAVGLKLPHAELAQATVQVTPAALLSLLTFAVKLAEAPAVSDAGGFESATEIGVDVVMVIEAEADFVESAADVAVTVTMFPAGRAAGAVNVVFELLPVDLVGFTEPHEVLPQCTVQVTPAPLLSLATTAARVAVAPTATDVGGLGMVTEIDKDLCPDPPHAASTKTKAIMRRPAARLRADMLIAANHCQVAAIF